MFLLLYLLRIDETGDNTDDPETKETSYAGNKTKQKKKKNSVQLYIHKRSLRRNGSPSWEEENGENRNASLATFGARSARGSRLMISKWRENFLVDKVRKLIDRM